MNQATFDYIPDESEKHERQADAKPVSEAKAGTEVSLIEIKQSELVALFSNEKGLDPIIEKIKHRVKTEVFDVTTEDGRARIGSIARQIGSAKMDLKRMGQALTEDWRLKTKAVTSETTRMEKELDTLRDSVLAPRIEYEAIEKNRVDGHKRNIEVLAALSFFQDEPSSEDVQSRINALKRDFSDIKWDEFREVAKSAREKVEKELAELLVKRKKAEADAAELERLRREQAEREQKERDDRIAAEAAEKAKKEAEEKARLEQEAKDRAAKAEQERLQREKDEAEARAAKAEQERKQAHTKAIDTMLEMTRLPEQRTSTIIASRLETLRAIHSRDWQEFVDQAKKVFTDAEKRLTQWHKEAVELEAEAKRKSDKEAADKAAQAERDRIAEEQRKQKEADDKRAADTAHKAKINNEALAVVQGIVDELTQQGKTGQEISKTILTWIAQGKIPHVSIKY